MAPCRLYTLKSPFFLKQISDIPRTNPRGTHFSNSSSMNKAVSIISMQQNFTRSKSTLNDDIHIRHAKELKNVKKIFIEKAKERSVDGLYMIDMIQRLGIEHHFEEEIQEAVRKQYLKIGTHSYYNIDHNLQLSEVALQFRLLRQQLCDIDTGVFGNFMDKKGRLRQKFWGDTEGLIELFEASQLSIEGEDDLHEAGNFTYHLLNSRFHDHHEANVIANTLKYPIHKSLPRFTPRNFHISNSQLNNGWLMPLENLSHINTQIANSISLKEIYAVSKWWKELGLAKDFKLARDEPIKWYMWSMACLTDPVFSEERIELTKPLSLVYIIDDIFDVYGSLDELTVFVDAVNRWDLGATEQLPDYLKACFKALYDITNEFSIRVQNKHGWNPIKTLIKSWIRLCNAFLEEAKWLSSGKLPNREEYLENGIVSTGVEVCLVHAFFMLGEGITNETLVLMDGFPPLVSSTSTILRLCHDLEGAKDNDQVGKDGSYLTCYMNDHPGVSEETAREHIKHKISDAWKCLNKECFTPTNPFPSSFAKVCLNAARMVPIMYSYENCSRSRLKEHVKSLLYGDGIREMILQKDQSLVL
ncbi:(3S,6E)-nerolidol synthase 1-like isoform X1 [Neltuma alba]|uniref:(3S,6E)-nerolidol synthase 1-like isoform X1 n=1 Tax=Neltuma alba TaxID=207710 RepID=UPI0010A358C3|nr:(3S,6E)-nerolidol synthase 1-like isoform X1 [Prosopis alba]